MLQSKSLKFKQILLSCLLFVAMVVGMAVAFPTRIEAAPLQALVADAARSVPEPNATQGAKKAEKGSDKVFEGLEKTQRIIGKTEKRNDAIEYAREHASERLDDLADKAKAADKGQDSLSKVDKVNLDLMLNPQDK